MKFNEVYEILLNFRKISLRLLNEISPTRKDSRDLDWLSHIKILLQLNKVSKTSLGKISEIEINSKKFHWIELVNFLWLW